MNDTIQTDKALRILELGAGKKIEVRKVSGQWQARADFTNGEWLATPYYGESILWAMAHELERLNPGYHVWITR